MPQDRDYTSNLAEFVDKTIRRWAADKKKVLEDKLKRNFEAVTNADFRTRAWKKGEGEDWRSQTWVGFVRVKVWSFYSVMLDTVLKGGKIPFVLLPSPYDEKYMDSEMLKERDERLKKMTAKIESQLAARHADREYMKKWLSLGYYGMAFSRFNIEDIKSVEFKLVMPGNLQASVQQGFISPQEAMQYARYEMVQESEAVPGHKYVSVWSMVWDLDSDDLQTGAGYAEHIKSSPWDLRKLDGPGYIPDAIDLVIQRNADKKDSASSTSDVPEAPGKAALTERKKTMDRYEFYMRVPAKYVEEFEQALRSRQFDVVALTHWDSQEAENSGYEVEIMGEIVDNEIIRYIRNDTGRRPHKMCVSEQNLDESTGTGIADNMASPQESLVGMINAFEDNKKLSANVIAAVKARYFNDPGQVNSIQPGTKFDIADGCDDVRKAIMPIVFPDVGESLMSGIQLMMQLKDDVSMIPTIIQGFNLPKHKPDTAYEMQRMEINAGKYIGQIIRNNDEQFIEPEIQENYEYNMLYGDDEDCKVNCKVQGNGFTSFQNKEVRGARMQQVLGMIVGSEVLAPYVEIEPHLEIIYEAMDEDPERFIKSEEKRNQEAQQQMQMQAIAQQQAMQMFMAEKGAEAKKDIAVKNAEHQHRMAEEDQEHEHRLIEDGVKAKMAAKMQKDKEINNASSR